MTIANHPHRQNTLEFYRSTLERGSFADLSQRITAEDAVLSSGTAIAIADTTDFRFIIIPTGPSAQISGGNTEHCLKRGRLYLRGKKNNVTHQLDFDKWTFNGAEVPHIAAFLNQHPGLAKATIPYVGESILRVYSEAVKEGNCHRYDEVRTLCQGVHDYENLLPPETTAIISEVLENAAKKGKGHTIADFLANRQSDPDNQRIVDEIAPSIIPLALTNAAEYGLGDSIAKLLAFCQTIPSYKEAADTVTQAIIPQALIMTAQEGGGNTSTELLIFCQKVPAYKKAADTVAPSIIPDALTLMRDKGWNHEVDGMVFFCKRCSDSVYSKVAEDWMTTETHPDPTPARSAIILPLRLDRKFTPS